MFSMKVVLKLLRLLLELGGFGEVEGRDLEGGADDGCRFVARGAL